MCSYYGRLKHVPNFSKIAEPLTDLTQCQIAFDFLKESLLVVPLLAYMDVNKPSALYTDASDNCIGACLTQKKDEGEKIPFTTFSLN